MLYIVITSINQPLRAILDIAKKSIAKGYSFIVIGDKKSPTDFHVDGCKFYSIDDQIKTDLKFAQACPPRHYARKNIGYLIAIQNGAKIIVETDDDNIPLPGFWQDRQPFQQAPVLQNCGWVNVYRYFSEDLVWPRGLPLDEVNGPLIDYETLTAKKIFCPIQQGLADDNPDVDAIYRLLLPLPIKFRSDRRIILGENAWCPFNSQNTSWWPEAYSLLYLPFYCSFRMTDIWRSFVAQRIAWLNGWSLLFHESTVFQERNEHNLMRDFEDEVPGYLNNRKIVDALMQLSLRAGIEHISDNMLICYDKLIQLDVVGAKELPLLQLWLEDLAVMR
jgi:hypothetical protein